MNFLKWLWRDLVYTLKNKCGATVTNTFTNGTTADADEVNTNFTDIDFNGVYDGGKTITADDGAIVINKSDDTVTFDINKSATGAGTVLDINNQGTGYGIDIVQGGAKEGLRVTGASTAMVARFYSTGGVVSDSDGSFYFYSNQVLTNPLVKINLDSVTSGAIAFEVNHTGTGLPIDTDAGAGTPAQLANDGTWTNASSTRDTKMNITEDTYIGYIVKIKALKLFKYQKKWHVYGSMDKILKELSKSQYNKDNPKHIIKEGKFYEKKGRKFRSKKIRPNARYFTGYILDDASTPEDLVSRDYDGNLTGVSPELGVNFLLGVCKEQQTKIDELEARIVALEP